MIKRIKSLIAQWEERKYTGVVQSGGGESRNTSLKFDKCKGGYFSSLTIEGETWQRTLKGKNLIHWELPEEEICNGVNFTKTEEGKVIVNGTASGDSCYSIKLNGLSAGEYTFSGCPDGGSDTSYYFSFGTTPYRDYGEGCEFKLDNASECYFNINICQGTVCNNIVFAPQVEKGSEKTYFEEYCGGIPAPNLQYKIEPHGVPAKTEITAEVCYAYDGIGGIKSDTYTFVTTPIELFRGDIWSPDARGVSTDKSVGAINRYTKKILLQVDSIRIAKFGGVDMLVGVIYHEGFDRELRNIWNFPTVYCTHLYPMTHAEWGYENTEEGGDLWGISGRRDNGLEKSEKNQILFRYPLKYLPEELSYIKRGMDAEYALGKLNEYFEEKGVYIYYKTNECWDESSTTDLFSEVSVVPGDFSINQNKNTDKGKLAFGGSMLVRKGYS